MGPSNLFQCMGLPISRVLCSKHSLPWVENNHSFTTLSFPLQKHHRSELPFVFHAAQPFFSFTTQEQTLSLQTITYWTNFAKTGDPNKGSELPQNVTWPVYSTATDPHMSFQTPQVKVETGLRNKYCDFWDTIGYQNGA